MEAMTTPAHTSNYKLKDKEPIIYECDCTLKVYRWVVLNYNFLKGKIMTHVEGVRQVRGEIRVLRGGYTLKTSPILYTHRCAYICFYIETCIHSFILMCVCV